jgi:glycosyltransferase involved in cell wall biosynthesis
MILHVACLPFPTYQGTQAALAAMLDASARAGRETHVLTYGHSAYPLAPRYHVHRLRDFPRVHSLRSGPSLGKLALDARCIAAARRLVETLQPDAVVAHHVEAALAVRLAAVTPFHYVAHTSLESELSVYVPRLPASAVRAVGARLDWAALALAESTAAVAPALAARLGPGVTHLPVPWTVEAPSLVDRRPTTTATLLYAGNLDAYQGWEDLLLALRLLHEQRPNARLLIASESDPAPARREAARRGVLSHVDFRRLDGETARARVHAESDLAWIPRRTEGGLPIKMLDSFARGLPVVATTRAVAGLPVGHACCVIRNDDPAAFAAESARLLDDATARAALAEAGRQYLETHHSDEAYLTALDDLIGRRATPTAATPIEPRPPTARALRAR